MTNDLTARIRDVRFTPVRVGEGYDMGQVDYLLDRLEAAAGRGESLAPILDDVTLSEVRLREGYAIEDVDAFLLGSLRSWTETVPAETSAPTSVDVPTPAPAAPVPSVIVEQRGFFARLFGRR